MREDKVVYQHFRKAFSNFLVTLASSAMADKQKQVCLTQEVVRACRNCSRSLMAEVRSRALTERSLRLKDIGYSAAFRLEVIMAGKTANERQVERDEASACPLYHPKGYLEEERRKKKELEKMSWYCPYDTVQFCPPTPDSVLAKSLKKLLEVEGVNRPEHQGGGEGWQEAEAPSAWPQGQCGVQQRQLLPALHRWQWGLQEGGECVRGVLHRLQGAGPQDKNYFFH